MGVRTDLGATMQKPTDWKRETSSAELRERMVGLTGGTTLLAFSCGKDAIAAWLAIRPMFKRIIPVHYELVPGLDFVQRSLAYYEDFFGCKIIRRMHPSFVRMLRNCVFQPPERWRAIEEACLPGDKAYSHEAILDDVKAELGLDTNTFVATGVRAADSPYRRMASDKHGAVNWKRLSWWPVYDWKLANVDESLQTAGVKLPVDYLLWGRSFDGVDHRFLAPMRERLPEDYARVLEWFPLADLELFRRTLRT
jgi:hypothetical protein